MARGSEDNSFFSKGRSGIDGFSDSFFSDNVNTDDLERVFDEVTLLFSQRGTMSKKSASSAIIKAFKKKGKRFKKEGFTEEEILQAFLFDLLDIQDKLSRSREINKKGLVPGIGLLGRRF